MISTSDWLKIKKGLKKSVEPIFLNSGVNVNLPFDELLDIFHGVLTKEIEEKDLEDSDLIINALKVRYIEKDMDNFKPVLTNLTIKFESFIKRLFHRELANETLLNSSSTTIAPYLKTFWKKFKNIYNDNDFQHVSSTEINKFFAKNSNKKPTHPPEVFSRNSIPLGKQFKIQYDLANSERHLAPLILEDDLPKLITSVISCYLFLVLKYANRLEKKVIHKPDLSTQSNWNIFKEYCNNFDKHQSYFLISDKFDLPSESLNHLTNIPWDFVFDLDPNSDVDGLQSIFNSNQDFPYVITQITHTSDDRGIINTKFTDNTTFWYYINGNHGRVKSLLNNSRYADWRVMYGVYTQKLMVEYYKKKYSFNYNPIFIIILSKAKEKVRDIIYAIKSMNSNLNLTFVFANEDNSNMLDLIDEISGKQIDLPLNHLINGLKENENLIYSKTNQKNVYLPCISSSGKSIEIPTNIVNSIRQYFQIVHINILNDKSTDVSDKTFYQGRTIHWHELDKRYDIDRNITNDIVKSVKHSLTNRVESAIYYLSHYAGAGGTTIARRVAYDIHRDFPTFFLNETISSFGESELTEKLLQIFRITELPSFVVVDNSNITNQQIEMLEKIVGNRLAKTVFLLVESTFIPPKAAKNRFYVNSNLDKKNEAIRFVDKFSKEFPDKKSSFIKIRDENHTNTLTPFYFGLIAYENEYITIDDYVKKRLQNITDKEKDLLLLLAFCQNYAKGKFREVPHFILSKFLDTDEDFIKLRNHVKNPKIYDLIIETEPLYWKTIHPLIADRVLKELLGVNDVGKLNPFKLKETAITLLKALRELSEYRNEYVLEFLHNVFILRIVENSFSEDADIDFSDNLYRKNKFSKILNDLNNNETRIEVFDVLTTEFPDENSHFWGHFSRLYSINKDFDNALKVLEKALLIEEDPALYHIKGMCYRTELYRIQDTIWANKTKAIEVRQKLRDFFNEASDAFKKVRALAPKKSHGYNAFVQMVMKVLDFEYSISNLQQKNSDNSKDYTKFIVSNTWSRNILTQANEVIRDYKSNNAEFENPSIVQRQIQLLKYFGEKSKMINSWQGLLGKRNHDQNLVRRQLAYAYLAKNEFKLEKAREKDTNRIIDLVEENLANNVDVKDLRLWFEVSRQTNVNTQSLIGKIIQWEFQKPSLETAYLLMCLYGIQAINGIISGIDNYEKYRNTTAARTNQTYNKVFCIEWVGEESNRITLVNYKSLGAWNREKRFFQTKSERIKKLSGRVIKYISRVKGFIEIDGVGIQVMYQPGRVNHFSEDAQKQTKVGFYVGFNYDGARAFEVKNI